MNLLAKREHELPAELERTFPGVEEFFRSVFGSWNPELLHHHQPWGPVHDLKVEEKEVVLQLSCPGHKAEDFDVEITGNLISVKTCCKCSKTPGTLFRRVPGVIYFRTAGSGHHSSHALKV